MFFNPQEKQEKTNEQPPISPLHVKNQPHQAAGFPLFAQNTPASQSQTPKQPLPHDPFSTFDTQDRDYLHKKGHLTTGFEIDSTGELGQTTKKTPIKLHYFQGVSSERALVIAGVHGSERQGLEIAETLIGILKKTQPFFTVIIVPALFPDHVGKGRTKPGKADFGSREAKSQSATVYTNRNFVDVDADVAGYKDVKGGRQPVDAQGKVIKAASRHGSVKNVLHENALLMELIDRFQPHRIISIHGTKNPASAGVFADPHFDSPAMKKRIEATAELMHMIGMDKSKTAAEARKNWLKGAEMRNLAKTENDADLAIAAAFAIANKTKNLTTLEKRFDDKKHAKKFKKIVKDEPKRFSDPQDKKRFAAVVGNALDMGSGNETAIWREDLEPGKGFTPKSFTKRKKKGISLGLYGPAKGISVFTVEAAINRNAQDYADADSDKKIKDIDSTVSVADRKAELLSYAQVIAEVLLGPANGQTALKKHRS